MTRLFCCGGWICKQCSNERSAQRKAEGFDEMYRNKCPLCRGKMPREGEIGSMLLKHANKGRAWAQMHIGLRYFNGVNGYDLDKERGLKLIEESADQRDPDALLQLALAYTGEMLERDESKYVHYLKEAADLGHPDAQLQLALTYERQDNEKMLLHYITLAASQGDSTAC
eukprot:scaffold1331_cov66-Skeletonema_marinoi.AAC.1